MTLLTAPPEVALPRRRLRVAASAGYVLTGFPLAIVAFVLGVTGFALSAGLLVIMVGFAVLALTLTAAQGLARVERLRLDGLLGRRVPRPAYRELRPGTAGAVLSAGADPRRWLDLLHCIVGFPIAVATFAVVTAWSAAAVGGTGYVLWEWSLPRGDTETLAEQIGLGAGRGPDLLLTTFLGLVAAVTLPWVIRGCAALQAGVAWTLLVASADG